MAVSFELPREMEKGLRDELGDLDRVAKEVLLVDLYRRHQLTHHQFSNALNLSRLEADAVLKRHEVFHDLTARDVVFESEGLRKLRGEHFDRR